MAGRSKKSTKKFEKNHLKDTIDKRKEFAKIKQRHQTKAKKKARNASDNARVLDDDEKPAVPDSKRDSPGQADPFNKMSVDEFFQGGFELPEKKKDKSMDKKKDAAQKLGKRKRTAPQTTGKRELGSSNAIGDRSEFSDEEQSSVSDMELDTHQGDLDALAEKDPDFYEYLKENDAELLDFEENLNQAGVDKLSETEKTPKKKRKKDNKGQKDDEQVAEAGASEDGSDVTIALVEKWKTAMCEQHSLRAMRQVVLAFRAAAYINSGDGKEYRYSISGPEIYHQLLLVALQHVPNVLAHHLPAKESTTGKVRIATDSKKYRTLTPLLKSHAASVQYLLENLSDAPTIKLTLSSLAPLLPYLLPFKKVLKALINTTVTIWSDPSSTEAIRITAFLLIRRLAIFSDASLREAVLKTVYQGIVKGSRNTNTHTLAGINLMKNSAAELWGLDADVGYTTGFTYIRQLAVHLRTSITQPTKESYKAIYNWQYTHSLDFWSRVLSTHCYPATIIKSQSSSPLQPLIYPLVQITLGALRLIPTPAYFPLRFHLSRSLLRLSRATNTYIPLAPSLLEVLTSPELSKPPKASTLKPLDFATALRAPKSYLRTRIYQDGLGAQLAELLAEFFGCWAKHIAFPELVIPPTVLLKRWLKTASTTSPTSRPSFPSSSKKAKKRQGGNRNAKVNASIMLLLQKLDLNARWIEARRRTVTFGPGNRAAVEAFLNEVPVADTPLGAFVVGMRKQHEERERVLKEGRKTDEQSQGGVGRREGQRGAVGGGDDDDEERDINEDEEDGGSVASSSGQGSDQ
ncbi:Nucleolar Complex 2 protein [Pseudocyphellaria aurata]|nr:Nucleolar Complex 2 protein [Pseudocyphellaria aurata]